jgi:hypothetical protein
MVTAITTKTRDGVKTTKLTTTTHHGDNNREITILHLGGNRATIRAIAHGVKVTIKTIVHGESINKPKVQMGGIATGVHRIQIVIGVLIIRGIVHGGLRMHRIPTVAGEINSPTQIAIGDNHSQIAVGDNSLHQTATTIVRGE